MSKIITFDFETYYAPKYTLSTLSIPDYVLDERFKIHGAAVKIDQNRPFWLEPEDIEEFLIAHKDAWFLFHNAQFDAYIMSVEYRFFPRLVLDTLCLGALICGWYSRLGLKDLLEFLGGPQKGDDLGKSKGVRDLSSVPGLKESIVSYALNDVEITRWLFDALLKRGTKLLGKETLQKELRIIHETMRLLYPDEKKRLCVDSRVLSKAVLEEEKEEEQRLQSMAAQFTYPVAEFKKMLRSRSAFPQFMAERLGISIPTKVSKRTGKSTYALAKNDTGLKALRETLEGTPAGELLALRETVGSSIAQTRGHRLLRLADGRDIAPVPVFLNYGGAQQTLRWSGGAKLNLQNLPRGSWLRKSFIPPEGHKLVVCDYSSVEARVLAWLAQDEDLLRVFREGRDVYVEFGKSVWGDAMMEGADSDEDSPEYKAFKKRRFVSKTCVLGLGYSAGWTVLEGVLRTGSMGAVVVLDKSVCETLGVDDVWIRERLISYRDYLREKMGETDARMRWEALMLPLKNNADILWHFGATMRLVEIYRTARPAITALWRQMDIRSLQRTNQVGYVGVEWDEGDLRLRLPGGTVLIYPGMQESGAYGRSGATMHTYGAKLVENVTQAVARNLLRDAWLDARQKGLNVVLSVHDELVCVEKNEDAGQAAEVLTGIMSTVPVWAEGLPLGAEAKVVDSYAEK